MKKDKVYVLQEDTDLENNIDFENFTLNQKRRDSTRDSKKKALIVGGKS